MKKILIITEGQKISGPSTWERGLAKTVRNAGYEVIEINASKFSSLNLYKLLAADVVHGYHVTGSSLPLIFLSKILRKKVIFTIHGNYLEEVKNKSGLKRYLWIPFHRASIKLSDCTTVPSNYLLKALKVDLPRSNNIIVIPNGIVMNNKSIKSINSNDKKIQNLLEVTQFNLKQKALAVIPLIEAFKELSEQNDELTLHIIGDGPYLKIVKESAIGSENVFFKGKLSHRNTLNEIRTCDLFVHSSYLETFGYTVLEAMSYNKPIIASGTGGIVEILDKSCLVQPKKSAFKFKIKQFINYPHLRTQSIKSNGYRLGQFSWDKVGEKFINLYAGYEF